MLARSLHTSMSLREGQTAHRCERPTIASTINTERLLAHLAQHSHAGTSLARLRRRGCYSTLPLNTICKPAAACLLALNLHPPLLFPPPTSSLQVQEVIPATILYPTDAIKGDICHDIIHQAELANAPRLLLTHPQWAEGNGSQVTGRREARIR